MERFHPCVSILVISLLFVAHQHMKGMKSSKLLAPEWGSHLFGTTWCGNSWPSSACMTKLKCCVCDRITGRRNFSDKWFIGADCVISSNIRDHAKSNQHVHAMNFEMKEWVCYVAVRTWPMSDPWLTILCCIHCTCRSEIWLSYMYP